MKIKHYLIIGALGIAFTAAIFAGCKKDTTPTTIPTTTPDYTAAEDDNNAALTVQDTKSITDGAAQGQTTDRVLSSCWHCRMIPDTTYNGVKDSCWDINFGATDCTCTDGRLRRGEVLVFWNGTSYFSSNAVLGMTFRNYYMNDIGITGTRKLTNLGNGIWSFHASLTLAYPNGGGTATWSSTRTDSLKTVGGVSYFTVTGSDSGVSRKNTSYTVKITSPIYVTALPYVFGGCRYFESGAFTVTLPSYTIGVTYGTAVGTCSSAATASIDGQTFSFTQP